MEVKVNQEMEAKVNQELEEAQKLKNQGERILTTAISGTKPLMAFCLDAQSVTKS
jgi:hypothetical protein